MSDHRQKLTKAEAEAGVRPPPFSREEWQGLNDTSRAHAANALAREMAWLEHHNRTRGNSHD